MSLYNWEPLNHLQVGRYGETFVKLELTRLGLDVYTSEVDDRGIDFVIRLNTSNYLDIQVKTVRGYNYIYARKSVFPDSPNLFLAVVILLENEPPSLYLIPRTRWNQPDNFFATRDYAQGTTAPEYGLNLSAKNFEMLQAYAADLIVAGWSDSAT